MNYREKVAIVTGGASGIGLALCRKLVAEGATVIMADINYDDAVQHAAQIDPTGEKLHVERVDVSQQQAVVDLIETTASRFGRLDYMFNNAGIGGTLDFRQATFDHWRRIMDVNLWSVIYGTTAAYKIMVAQGSGHIVNTASISGLIPAPLQTLYNTTKYAIVGLSTTLRYEAATLGIKVSVVCPGFVATGIFGVPILGQPVKGVKAPPQAISADDAASIILEGVTQNKEKIIFPAQPRLWDLLYRFAPLLLQRSFEAETKRRMADSH